MAQQHCGKLVIIVGVDGAGKTTFLQEMTKYMPQHKYGYLSLDRQCFPDYIEEFQITPYVANFMLRFKELLWGAQATDPITDLSDSVWLHMHAIWYEVFQTYLLTPALAKYDYVIFDSWYYKIMARYLVNPHYHVDMFDRVFGQLQKGDLGLMLDTDVAVCANRKSTMSPGELGRHHYTLHEVDPYKRFIQYQSQVREKLLQLCQRNHWLVCSQTHNWTEHEYQQVAQWIQSSCNITEFGQTHVPIRYDH